MMDRETGLEVQRFIEERAPGCLKSRPELMNAIEGLEAIVAVREVMRPACARVAHLPYDPQFEARADDAVRAICAGNWTADGVVDAVLRVLWERVCQADKVMMANALAGTSVMVFPASLPAPVRKAALVLSVLLRMKLPFEVAGPTLH